MKDENNLDFVESLNKIRIVYCKWCGKKIRETEEPLTLFTRFEFCSKTCRYQWDYDQWCEVGDGTDEVEKQIEENRERKAISLLELFFGIFRKKEKR